MHSEVDLAMTVGTHEDALPQLWEHPFPRPSANHICQIVLLSRGVRMMELQGSQALSVSAKRATTTEILHGALLLAPLRPHDGLSIPHGSSSDDGEVAFLTVSEGHGQGVRCFAASKVLGSLGFEPRPSQIKSLERYRLRHDPGRSRIAAPFPGHASFLRVVRGGIAPATGDVSDRHASVTTPDRPVGEPGVEPGCSSAPRSRIAVFLPPGFSVPVARMGVEPIWAA
jgi:hypothetical protein